MQHYEVGDAFVLGEGQTQRRFGAVVFAVDPVGVLVTVHMAVGYVLAWSEEETEELESSYTAVRFDSGSRDGHKQSAERILYCHVTMEMF